MNPVDLQELIDRELKRLPTPRAPRTLLPRILAATVERPMLPWYRRGWSAWPLRWQVASAAVLVALLVGGWWFIPALHQLTPGTAAASASAAPNRVVAAANRTGEILTVVRVFWRVVLQPVAVYLFALALSLTLACAVIWTALERLTLGGASQQ